jgi:hypothetical protein
MIHNAAADTTSVAITQSSPFIPAIIHIVDRL